MTQFRKIGVIGAGNMGSGIAQKIAQEGLPVVMVDIQESFVERGLNTIKGLLDEGVARKLFAPAQVTEIMSRITGTTDFNQVADADLVVEAVFEDKQVKLDLFKKLEDICSPETILATNTSSFYVKDFAEALTRPERMVGLHYFYHPAKNRLLEVIPHAGSDPRAVEKSLLFSKLHGKTAILVKDAPGFAVNRFFVPFLNEAVRMLEEGLADIPTIEAGAKQAFRIGMGPFQLMNVTGIPIAVHAATTLGNELGPFYAPCETLRRQMEKKVNWELEGAVNESQLAAVAERFYGVCLGVAAALVDEGVASIEDTDRGAKIGLRWQLGPFEIMNKIGIARTYQAVSGIVARYIDFKMPGLLEQQHAAGKPFEFTLVDLAVKNRLATITINRPEAMNALNPAVVAQLTACFDQAEADPEVDAICFQGAGKAFVAGADIRFFVQKIKADQIAEIVEFTRQGHNLLLRIETCKKPTIAILDGLSLGGGSELALACQAIVATPAGSMAFPETSIGIYPGLGGMLRMARQTGLELAKYYVFTGAALSAQDAFELGIVTRLTAPAELDGAVSQLLTEGLAAKYRARALPDRFKPAAGLFAGKNAAAMLDGQAPASSDTELAAKTLKSMRYKAPLALKIANAVMDAQKDMPMPEAIEIELNRLAEIFSTADALEGLSSLGRKRPEYKGV